MHHEAHWEWRGFGGITPQFAKRFLSLPPHFSSQQVKDHYIWAPGLQTNIKFREGAEDGLKFKRRIEQQRPFEKWLENPEEIFDFPLNKNAWQTLCADLKPCGITLPDYSSLNATTRPAVKTVLKSAGCAFVQVQKERSARLYSHDGIFVVVEWAVIFAPVRMVSVGLENVPAGSTREAETIEAMHQTMKKLGVTEQPLQAGSYLNRLSDWYAA